MIIQRGFKTELAPNNVQQTLLAKSSGAARWAYNWGLRRKEEVQLLNELPVPRVKVPTAVDLHRELNQLKKAIVPWMYEVSKCAPQEALRSLDVAFKNMFEDLKDASRCRGRSREHRKGCGRRHVRYPCFKSRKGGLGSFTVTGSIMVTQRHVTIPRVGRLRLNERGYLPAGRHGAATVSERAGRWFVSVHVAQQRHAPPNDGPLAGVDLGLNRLATVSDGSFIENPRHLKRRQKKLTRLQQEVSRKRKGSRNRRKAVARLARQHKHVADARLDFIHKATTRLARTKSVIGVESLNVSGLMKNHALARAFADAAWGRFLRQLAYKAPWNGGRVVEADPWFPSTRQCSGCGRLKEVPLSQRTYACAPCGLVIDRDLNSALNLEGVAASSAETVNACQEVAPTRLAGQVASMNQEVNAIPERGING